MRGKLLFGSTLVGAIVFGVLSSQSLLAKDCVGEKTVELDSQVVKVLNECAVYALPKSCGDDYNDYYQGLVRFSYLVKKRELRVVFNSCLSYPSQSEEAIIFKEIITKTEVVDYSNEVSYGYCLVESKANIRAEKLLPECERERKKILYLLETE